MIDRLEEVLGTAHSREELARLEEKLRQWGVMISPLSGEMEEERATETSACDEGYDLPSAGDEKGEQNGLTELLGNMETNLLPGGRSAAAVRREELAFPVPVRADYGALLDLYRQTAQAAAPVGMAGVSHAPVVIREEHSVDGGLTAQELDLAVRRDSRRYDGAVHIY